MKVEIWSDIMCPFCYIGKRRFEEALENFPHKNEVQIEWKSFQLNPEMVTDPTKNINEYLSEVKGWSLEQAESMNTRVTDMAKEAGLIYHLNKSIVANSFNAHRLIQFAKTKNLGDAAEERLFLAYFTEGKNMDDTEILLQLGLEIGLDKNELNQVLSSNVFSDEVKQDIFHAGQIGVRGVPFFVLNNKYAISGAQSADTFLGALEQTWNEMKG